MRDSYSRDQSEVTGLTLDTSVTSKFQSVVTAGLDSVNKTLPNDPQLQLVRNSVRVSPFINGPFAQDLSYSYCG